METPTNLQQDNQKSPLCFDEGENILFTRETMCLKHNFGYNLSRLAIFLLGTLFLNTPTTLWQLWGFKVRRTTFLNNTKFAYLLIVKL